jgi:hypothetical protein
VGKQLRFGTGLVVLVLAAAVVLTVATTAQDAADPTVAAYQTQVAELQGTIAALQTQVADLGERADASHGTPIVADTQDIAEYAIGEAFTTPDWGITVTGWEISPTLTTDYETNTARGTYVLVHLVVTKSGNEAGPFPYTDLSLKTGEGRTYPVDTHALFNLQYNTYGLTIYTDLQPGLPYETGVVFDVPPDSTQMALSTTDGLFNVPLVGGQSGGRG